MTAFVYFKLTGINSEKFLQGQLTANASRLDGNFLPTAICNLKGRVQFGLWIHRTDDGFGVVLSDDLVDNFKAHIKKYGAFSKITLSEPTAIYPAVIDGTPSFDFVDKNQTDDWQKISIAQGNYWITKATSELFAPQELRLHQRGGVAYDKGCYLGQEIVARLYFKARPKAFLHRVAGQGLMPNAGDTLGKIEVINSIATADGWQALVIARPDELTASSLAELELPQALQADVGRRG